MTAYSIADFVSRWTEIEKRSAEMVGLSLADELAICEGAIPGTIDKLFDELEPTEILQLAYDWEFWARPKQAAIIGDRLGAWRIMLYIGGRGGGKTRPATEWISSRLGAGARELLFIGPTYDDIKQFMLGGFKKRIDACNGSGLFDILPPWVDYEYKEDEGTVEFPSFKAVLHLHSAQLAEYRGPAPDTVWGDELLKWRHPAKLISNVRLACREVGKVEPQLLFTTSPKKLQFIRDLVMDPDVVTIHLDTRENRGNVSEAWLRSEERRLEGTAQGDEELGGKLGIDEEGTIFKLAVIDANRIELDKLPSLDRIVVAIDPGGSQQRYSDPTGIVGCGRAGDITTGHGYIIDEATKRYAWHEWAKVSFDMLLRLGGSAFVLERNNFADAAIGNLRTEGASRGYATQPRPGHKHLYDLVHPSGHRIQIIEVLAKVDKGTRARTVETLYTPKRGAPANSGRIHHCGNLEPLESEMTSFDPSTGGPSPNGMDALVHGLVELFALDRVPVFDASNQVAGIQTANKKLADAAPAGRSLSAAGSSPQWRSVRGDRGRTI